LLLLLRLLSSSSAAVTALQSPSPADALQNNVTLGLKDIWRISSR
jgi:hypothetical protein